MNEVSQRHDHVETSDHHSDLGMAAPPPAPRGGMSLYADLLDGGSADASTEKTTTPPAPKQPEAPKNPALRFQPVIRRPQQAKAKAKPKLPVIPPTAATGLAQTAALPATAVPTTTSSLPSIAFAPPSNRTTLADWTKGGDGDDDDDDDGDAYQGGSGIGSSNQKWQQRGGRKRKKKRHEDKHGMGRGADAYVDWDELYDPTRPTILEAYLHSDERVSAAIEWKGVLYAHRRKVLAAKDQDRDDEANMRGAKGSDNEANSNSSGDERPPQRYNNAFAPPPPAAFAPPTSYDTPPTGAQGTAKAQGSDGPPPALAPEAPTPGLVVSKAPVRFEPAAAAASPDHHMRDAEHDDNGDDIDVDDEYQPSFAFDTGDRQGEQLPPPRSNRPGQAGFAARLMAKYGWTKGTGLGADESGIINPLRHKRINAGAGATGPAMGRIVGGQKKKTANTEEGTAGPSPVIVLRNMVDGMPDLAAEVADGQLVQEIGEECGEQYGRIERVYIDVPSQLVFIKFTETVSALRAVNALNGRVFNGSAITPSFYDADKFEAGIYQ
ncbi:g-patch dna repair protein [Ophiostoma piceae UAMH 11346]|uniref:G-patch dna repair protein n=1 Tax=Ophiostoma piceae (strain UAMH 11346) TaxID=1262450 RepID=S3CH73_OPHP1|nr:g-patch dna repair protein [Ophiostoma piceae UAMH 11346]